MTPRQVQVLIGLGVAIAVLLVVLIAVLVIGGGDEPAGPTALSTSTSTSASTSTTSSTTTSTSSTTTSTTTTTTSTSTTSTSTSTTTTTTLPAGACAGPGAGPLPGGALVVVDVMGDFDGDGAEDRFLLYEDPGGDYRARVELSYGYSSVAPDLVPGSGVINAKSVDLGGPGELAIAESLTSPSARTVSFYALDECDLDAVRKGDGTLAQFPLRSSGAVLAGVTCAAGGIEVTSAEDIGGGDWEVSAIFYEWVPAEGKLQGSMGAAAILHSPEDDAAIQSHADWNC